MWNVDIELIAGWLASLDDDSGAQVVAAIELLEEHGPQLGVANRRYGVVVKTPQYEGAPAGLGWTI
ncbi:hypothetical protein [Glutamicibacter mysorens]|uniref:hypothetical protein n=1 Tax=Glutamicibacter mysorens TaxID=257984 RepID=UPI001B809641|nr:hypothetical protein [Glutamicibacter mysorens]